MIYDKHKPGNRHFFLVRRILCKSVGLNEATIKKYIQDQEKIISCRINSVVKGVRGPLQGVAVGTLTGAATSQGVEKASVFIFSLQTTR